MRWVYDDGGRAAAGFRGWTGDCVTRAIAIATELPYRDAYDLINTAALDERPRTRRDGSLGRRSSARLGVARLTTRRLLADLGWNWTATMGIGTGCKVHLRDGELPGGRIIVRLSGHVSAVVDGVIRDTLDPSRGGTRCVYGYWARQREPVR